MGARVVSRRYRLAVASRAVAAVAGGYGVAALAAIALACALPAARIEAVAIGMIVALLAWPAAAMGCFWARSATRAWGGILLCAAMFGGLALATGWRP